MRESFFGKLKALFKPDLSRVLGTRSSSATIWQQIAIQDTLRPEGPSRKAASGLTASRGSLRFQVAGSVPRCQAFG
jgi:hypothetical protein